MSPLLRLLAMLSALALAAGCSPALEGAKPIGLVPVESILAQAETPNTALPTGDGARAAALRARAAALRRPVLDAGTQAALEASLSR